MSTHKEIGIVIKKMDYDDFDEIITILSRTGLVTLIALGVRKLKSKNRVALQLGNLIEVEYFKARLEGKISKLKKGILLKQARIENPDSAKKIVKLMKYFRNIDTHSTKLFDAYVETFDDWGQMNNHLIETYILVNLLDVVGSYPNFISCVECGRSDQISGFEFHIGGFTCGLHTIKKRDVETLKAFAKVGQSWKTYKTTTSHIDFVLNNEVRYYLKTFFY